MNRAAFLLLLLCCLFVTSFSCSNQPRKSRKPVSSITLHPAKKNYVFGEKVTLRIQTKVKNGEIQNTELFLNNKLMANSKELDFTVVDLELTTIGTANFQVKAVKTDGVSNTRSQSITVVSDKVPDKYSYKTINTFPHSREYFTQGLEFHKGFLYEGTGEHGTSGIYKLQLETGNELQKTMLPDHYFGEGITILNDKIYQLTYRSQKGFVYNLSDFALIDSFQYRSKEGWGLTNDGTNLIMSDGTQYLTWLNPSDFSVVKTLQVANDKGIINYLNELEYIDGILYANVYTTDLIVKIDPETGKVLAEINLAGLINMYKNSTDKIDYLNGIAYDKKSDRLFVTGKLWPRLFEIELVEAPLNLP